MKTKAITGVFAEKPEKIYKYKLEQLNFKTACEILGSGAECVCITTGERIGMCPDGSFKVNFDIIGFNQFIESYSDEIFREG